MQKLDMKKLNRVFRKLAKRGTHGVSLEAKCIALFNACGEQTPVLKCERIALASDLLRQFNKDGLKKGGGVKTEKRASAHTSKPIKSESRKQKSDAFYASWEWKQVRYEALVMHGRQCMVCGFTPTPGCKERLVVDHIKPRSKFPDLALSLSNLQILCNSCNMGKSNIHQHDFRAEWHGHDEEETDPLTAQFNATMQ